MSSIAPLLALLRHADGVYYATGDLEMSDESYDLKKDQLRALVAEADQHDAHDIADAEEYLEDVGAESDSGFPRVAHEIPMGSQNHARNSEEFKKWYDQVTDGGRHSIILTWKMDGSSVAATYAGKLDRVVTRGKNGVGSNITPNALLWHDMPQAMTYDGRCHVRGEAQLFNDAWHTHFKGTSNPRSAGNGTIMRQDDQKQNVHIRFTAFDAIGALFDQIPTQHALFTQMRACGFSVVLFTEPLVGWDAVLAAYETFAAVRPKQAFDVDGLVAYINDRALQKSLGAKDNGRRPHGQMAWKFPPEEKEAVVTDIILAVGKTGAMAPVAIIEPISIGGITVSRATLSSAGRIEDLGLHAGDTILLRRANDVIPYIVRVLRKTTPGSFVFPQHCPSCGTRVVRDGAHVFCTNHDHCPAQSERRILSWLKKQDIKYMGKKMLPALMHAGVITSIASLYTLQASAVAEVEGGHGKIGTKMAEKIIQEIRATVGCPLFTFLGSCNIPHVGRRQAHKMLDAWKIATLKEFLERCAGNISGQAGIGPEKATAIVHHMQRHAQDIVALAELVKPSPHQIQALKAGTMVFCMTGALSRSKADIAVDIVAAGHVVSDDVNSTTTHVVQADPTAITGKSKKAAKRGLPIITEKALMILLVIQA